MGRILAIALLVACSSNKDPKGEPAGPLGTVTKARAAPAPAAPPSDDSPRGLCQRGCKKLMGCAGADQTELAACIDTCAGGTPQKAQIEQLERMTCEQIVQSAGNPSGGGAPAPAAGGTGCTADCTGCAGDDSSCFAIAGGSHGIPCDPCCCAPGGPSPTWRSNE